jgi:hypothetical protein
MEMVELIRSPGAALLSSVVSVSKSKGKRKGARVQI